MSALYPLKVRLSFEKPNETPKKSLQNPLATVNIAAAAMTELSGCIFTIYIYQNIW